MQVNFITILLLILLLIIIYNFFISNNTENFTKSEELILNKNLINQKKLTLYIFLSIKCCQLHNGEKNFNTTYFLFNSIN